MILNANELKIKEYTERVRALIGERSRYYFVITFGCQQNEADSEKIRGIAEQMGYLPTDSAQNADLIILNTCAIREHAESKVLSMLGRFKEYKHDRPDIIIGVCGCMAAEAHVADMIKKNFKYVTFTLEPAMLHRIPELVENALVDGERSFLYGEDCGDIIEGLPAVRSSGHKAWVSVMYGCNNFCSYCIVPYTRGRERSRSSTDIINECRELVLSGIKEITLLGQNVNSYKSDMNFAELISAIAEIDGDFIIRFMTSHPKDTSDELISAMNKYKPKIAPYFHLPLQSGSDGILKKMNRTYTSEKYLSIVNKLRSAVPGIAISTDIIVGFPGESEEDFLETVRILETVRFDMVYAFIYSPRNGTRAARMEEQIPQDVKSERLSRLLSMQDGISLESNLPYVGCNCRVLADSLKEKDGKTVYVGRTDTNKLVHFASDKAPDAVIGKFINVEIERAGAFILLGSEK